MSLCNCSLSSHFQLKGDDMSVLCSELVSAARSGQKKNCRFKVGVSLGMYFVNEGPHKDESTNVSVCVEKKMKAQQSPSVSLSPCSMSLLSLINHLSCFCSSLPSTVRCLLFILLSLSSPLCLSSSVAFLRSEPWSGCMAAYLCLPHRNERGSESCRLLWFKM